MYDKNSPQDQANLLRQVYNHLIENTSSFELQNIGADFTYFVGAVLKNDACTWPESRPFVRLLRGLPGAVRDVALSYTEPPAPPRARMSEWEVVALAVTGHVPGGERAILLVPQGAVEPTILALGESLGAKTRAGAVLAQALAAGQERPWIVAFRPGSSRVMKQEFDAADRIMAGGRLVDLQPAGVILVTSGGARLLASEISVDDPTSVPLPAPGEGDSISMADVPSTCALAGLAPVGVRWYANRVKGSIYPHGDCPAREFAVTHAFIGNRWIEVR